MEIDRQAFETWKQLYSRWCEARGRALKARAEVHVALMKCIYGAGRPPSQRRLERVRRLEHDAEWLRIQMDAKIFTMFGSGSDATSASRPRQS